MMADSEIRRGLDDGSLGISPFEDSSLQPASYDLRAGDSAFTSTTKQKVDLKQRGVVVIEPGPTAKPYEGPRQDQTGITDRDIQELTQTEALTLGGVVETLGALAADVRELKGSIGRLSWSIPLLVAFGIAVIAVISCYQALVKPLGSSWLSP